MITFDSQERHLTEQTDQTTEKQTQHTPVNVTEYQQATEETAVYPSPFYPYFALIEEVGELYGKFSRMFRGDDKQFTEEEMRSEMGDIMWNVAQICQLRGWSLEDIMRDNLEKLKKRAQEQTLKGSGDKR
jgi:NTP pyrophosphatase (non-canonical NTP hydrolase)